MIDVQKGESDELSRCVDTLLEGVMDGQIERYVMFYSKSPVNKHAARRVSNVYLLVECIMLSMQVLVLNLLWMNNNQLDPFFSR